MTTAQKIIKYFAIALAVSLIISIVTGILSVFFALTGVLGLKQDIEEMHNKEMSLTSFENADITTLDIELLYTNLTIKQGDILKVETNNDYIECKQNNDKLEVKERNHQWFSNNENINLIIYLPQNIEFQDIDIQTGAGKIDVETLTTDNLSFELGAGETKIESLNVLNKCDIDGGAGKVDILAGKINDLDLDMGVGEINLAVTMTGKNDIDAGVGNLNIELLSDKESYKIKADKGLGTIKIDGKDVTDGEIFGNGENYIEVDGGIGNIEIKFEQE